MALFTSNEAFFAFGSGAAPITNPFLILAPDNTAGPVTETILTTDIAVKDRTFIINDEAGLAGTNTITVDTEGGETIDGASSVVITANNGVVRLYSNGSNLFSF